MGRVHFTVSLVLRGAKKNTGEGGWTFQASEFRERRFGVWDLPIGEIRIMGIGIHSKSDENWEKKVVDGAIVAENSVEFRSDEFW